MEQKPYTNLPYEIYGQKEKLNWADRYIIGVVTVGFTIALVEVAGIIYQIIY